MTGRHRKVPVALTGTPARMKSLPVAPSAKFDISYESSECMNDMIKIDDYRRCSLIEDDRTKEATAVRKCVYAYEDKYSFNRIISDDSFVFDSHFESGNLHSAFRVMTPQEASYSGCRFKTHTYELYMHNDLYTSGNTQWFFFRVSNMSASQGVHFHIKNFRKAGSLFNDGMRPLLYSTKSGKGWVRCGTDMRYYHSTKTGVIGEQLKEPTNKKKSQKTADFFVLVFSHVFEHDDDECYFAFSYPYTYTDLQRCLLDIQRDKARSEHMRRSVLCRTVAGNACDLVTITAPAHSPEELCGRTIVVISARVHPGEVNSSWIMHGVLNFLTSDHVEAVELRKRYVFKLIPMLNPDGVINGNYRTSLSGCDLNRRWANPDPTKHPTVFATKALIQRYRRTGRPVKVVFDLHGHSRKQGTFVYGCVPDRKMVVPEALENFHGVQAAAGVTVGGGTQSHTNHATSTESPRWSSERTGIQTQSQALLLRAHSSRYAEDDSDSRCNSSSGGASSSYYAKQSAKDDSETVSRIDALSRLKFDIWLRGFAQEHKVLGPPSPMAETAPVPAPPVRSKTAGGIYVPMLPTPTVITSSSITAGNAPPTNVLSPDERVSPTGFSLNVSNNNNNWGGNFTSDILAANATISTSDAFACRRDVLNWRVRLLPRMLDIVMEPAFSLQNSTFKLHRSKAGTMRLVAFMELGIDTVYTVEASMAGAGNVHYTETDLMKQGECLCLGLLAAYFSLHSSGGRSTTVSLSDSLSRRLSGTTFGQNRGITRQFYSNIDPSHSTLSSPFSSSLRRCMALFKEEITVWRQFYRPEDFSGCGADMLNELTISDLVQVHDGQFTDDSDMEGEHESPPPAAPAPQSTSSQKTDKKPADAFLHLGPSNAAGGLGKDDRSGENTPGKARKLGKKVRKNKGEGDRDQIEIEKVPIKKKKKQLTRKVASDPKKPDVPDAPVVKKKGPSVVTLGVALFGNIVADSSSSVPVPAFSIAAASLSDSEGPSTHQQRQTQQQQQQQQRLFNFSHLASQHKAWRPSQAVSNVDGLLIQSASIRNSEVPPLPLIAPAFTKALNVNTAAVVSNAVNSDNAPPSNTQRIDNTAPTVSVRSSPGLSLGLGIQPQPRIPIMPSTNSDVDGSQSLQLCSQALQLQIHDKKGVSSLAVVIPRSFPTTARCTESNISVMARLNSKGVIKNGTEDFTMKKRPSSAHFLRREKASTEPANSSDDFKEILKRRIECYNDSIGFDKRLADAKPLLISREILKPTAPPPAVKAVDCITAVSPPLPSPRGRKIKAAATAATGSPFI